MRKQKKKKKEEKKTTTKYKRYINQGVFASVLAVTFQSVFYLEMYQNNIIFILKNYF
jgi:hypothetical protein